MGGGSEFPAELMKALFNGQGKTAANESVEKLFEKQDKQTDGKLGKETKIKKSNRNEKEEKKEKVMKLKKCSEVDKAKRQPDRVEVQYTGQNSGSIQSEDEGEEERKDREEEKRNKKEMLVTGYEKSRTREAEKAQDINKEVSGENDCRLEEMDKKTAKDTLKRMEDHVKLVMKKRKELAKAEKDEKKHKEKEKHLKKYDKKEKKEVTIPEVENGHGNNELLDKTLTADDMKDRRNDKKRYNVEKLKNKLSRLDAKMERIAAKSEIYLKKLRDAEISYTTGGQIVNSVLKESIADKTATKPILPSAPIASELDLVEMYGVSKESTADKLTNKVILPSAPVASGTVLAEIYTEVIANEPLEKISERIFYPKLEEKDMTGVGY